MALPDNYRKATSHHKRCLNCFFYKHTGNKTGFCSRWDANVEFNYVCNAWKSRLQVTKDA